MTLKCDFHIHSCLSPCGDSDMTPQNIVNLAKLLELDVIALTDHNTCGNCRAAMSVGEKLGVTVIAGMELTTSEEVHIVCLFKNIDDAERFSDYVHSTLPPINNKPSVFGEQEYRDENDEVTGTEKTLLITASAISCAEAVETVSRFGGICFPAHIDRSSFSIISNLATIDESFGFTCAEIFDIEKEAELKKQFPHLEKLKIISDSDAHYLENMRPCTTPIECEENSTAAVLKILRASQI